MCRTIPPLLGLLLLLSLSLGCGQKKDPRGPSGPDDGGPAETSPTLFQDMTEASGLRFTYRNGEDTADHLSILESLGGGAGLIDYDGDGLLDVFLTGGGGYAGADRKDIVGQPCKLFRNRGGCKFEDVTAEVGLEKLAGGRPWFYSHGVAVADYDRDGWPDLLVTGWGGVALFRNVPADPEDPRKGRRFVDVTKEAGLATGIDWATSAAWADLDGDGYPDLYVCQYVDWSWKKHPKCNYDGKTPDVCPPKEFSGLTHKLYRNTGKGTFLDVGEAAGLKPGGPTSSKGLGVIILDLDGDGKPDIYVANDTVEKFLYLNKSQPGKILLTECGFASGAACDDRGTPNGSMGLDAGDPDRTGKPALWVTNYENELHALYRNYCKPGHAFFQHRTTTAGIAALGQQYVGWGTAFLDADRDGWEDLFVVNGHAIRHPTAKGSSRKQRPVLLMNQGGKFHLASSRIGDYQKVPRLARGVAFGDLDNDGRTDLVVSHMNEPAAVLRGVGGEGTRWLGVRLVGKDHACVVGARVTLAVGGQTLTRFAKAGGSYLSSNDPRLLFGLGPDKPGRLTVTWPGGGEQVVDGLAPDRYYRVVQGRPGAEPESPR